jgi:hypothetical protein
VEQGDQGCRNKCGKTQRNTPAELCLSPAPASGDAACEASKPQHRAGARHHDEHHVERGLT